MKGYGIRSIPRAGHESSGRRRGCRGPGRGRGRRGLSAAGAATTFRSPGRRRQLLLAVRVEQAVPRQPHCVARACVVAAHWQRDAQGACAGGRRRRQGYRVHATAPTDAAPAITICSPPPPGAPLSRTRSPSQRNCARTAAPQPNRPSGCTRPAGRPTKRGPARRPRRPACCWQVSGDCYEK